MNTFLTRLLLSLFVIISIHTSMAQEPEKDTSGSHVYRPYSQRMRMEEDTLAAEVNEEVVLEESIVEEVIADTITDQLDQYKLDSIAAREQYLQDSLLARQQFVQDSIIAREAFVRDSLLRRQQIIDSLTFLTEELPRLLEASVFLLNRELVINTSDINMVGDSILSDYEYTLLLTSLSKPYLPWKAKVNLSDNPALIDIDTIHSVIKNINTPGINDFYAYNRGDKVIKIIRQGMFASKHSKKYYKAPVDSIFFDANHNITKIKRYYMMYSATDSYQRGALLFNFLYQVRQYTYTGTELSSYETVKFCDRWQKSDQEKVCNISNYTIQKQAYTYIVNRNNNPANAFSDGTYRYEFDNVGNMRSVSFRNNSGTENWKTFVEFNEHEFVSRYVYQENGIVNRTLLVNYYLDDPNAKHKVETITCTFEDDGISYYQRNNTTEKSRIRDRMTGEWSRWE